MTSFVHSNVVNSIISHSEDRHTNGSRMWKVWKWTFFHVFQYETIIFQFPYFSCWYKTRRRWMWTQLSTCQPEIFCKTSWICCWWNTLLESSQSTKEFRKWDEFRKERLCWRKMQGELFLHFLAFSFIFISLWRKRIKSSREKGLWKINLHASQQLVFVFLANNFSRYYLQLKLFTISLSSSSLKTGENEKKIPV